MTKNQYLRLAMTMPTDWLRDAMNNPSAHMRPVHVKIIAIALRRKRAL